MFTTIYIFFLLEKNLTRKDSDVAASAQKETGDNEIQNNAYDSMPRFHRSALNPVATHVQRGCYVPR
jgi:hypothetical protein